MKKISTFFKILGVLLFNFFIFQVSNPFLLTIILALFVGLLLPLNPLLVKRLKTIIPVAIMIILFQLLFNSSVGIDMRFSLGYLAAIRIIIISLSVLLFLTITSMSEIVRLFSFLPKNAVLLIMMTCYFIPGILNESEKIKAVQKSRGMTTNNFHIITSLASLLVPLLHRVFQRAETLSLTLLARGYEE